MYIGTSTNTIILSFSAGFVLLVSISVSLIVVCYICVCRQQANCFCLKEKLQTHKKLSNDTTVQHSANHSLQQIPEDSGIELYASINPETKLNIYESLGVDDDEMYI